MSRFSVVGSIPTGMPLCSDTPGIGLLTETLHLHIIQINEFTRMARLVKTCVTCLGKKLSIAFKIDYCLRIYAGTPCIL